MPNDADIDLSDDEISALTAERDDDDDLVKKLRAKLKSAGKELKDLRPLRGEVAEIKLNEALTKAFDDDEIKQISAEKKTAMLAIAGDDKSPEALRKVAETLGFVEVRVDPQEQELQAHERIERVSTGAPAGSSVKLDAEAVSDWSTEKQLRFRSQHPDAWEQIKRGETVTGIAF